MSMDWKEAGLRAGLEIHQQLDTERKLFCRCLTTFSEAPSGPDVMRRLRPVAGETGEVDPAALHEFRKGRFFVYKTYSQESCLIDLDSEPPLPLNQEALKIALEIALLLNCEIPDEIHVMRKIVIDGSNTTGFQRTAVIGLDGSLSTAFGPVGIQGVSLEEESAQILERGPGRTVFGLNRAGIPLVEISTAPDIHTPEQGRELAEKLGLILRSSRVKRGLGTIRQDLNISVKGGGRVVEIKGVQDLKNIPLIIETEAQRQLGLKAIAKEVRKASPDGSTTFLRPLPGAARLYPETDCFPVRIGPAFLKRIRDNLPELLEAKRSRAAQELGVGEATIKALEKARKLDLFRKLAGFSSLNPSFTSQLLLSMDSEMRSKGARPERAVPHLEKVLAMLDKGEIAKESVMSILADLSLQKDPDLAKYRLGHADLESDIKTLLEENPGLSFGAYMGILMGKLRGKVAGEEISRALKKALG